jgi:hypothetical protein
MGEYAPRLICFRGTTNASGDVTLDAGNDREGAFPSTKVGRSTNTYTVTIGVFLNCKQIQVQTGVGTVTAKSYSASAGTVTFTMSATQVSTFIDVFIQVDRGYDM